ncbi:MAG: saccharopine dehydrogenase NADP-binding domain-containing protein [Elusimicrobia bacterium]|nr:saccharopine dehydrogenase NADP-binding domain-containing protein [Elusimicrobiota bacterium]MDE2236628.1 saccharopine dehydrogenase NADP-binding domain-containing protein [Elusimicrobiota bacterium]MDE2426627.1 saccharopine dehydrogenase NADP-binding domain-containing protein [Elusimicrobiota bacterium]
MRALVIGAGMQGRACAYDLLKNPGLERLTLADADERGLERAARWLDSRRLKRARLDACDASAVKALARGHDVVVSCVPYFLNLTLAKAAIAARCHFVDLGGNTEIVLKELALHERARAAGVTLLPDVGLGPGMTTTLAVHGMGQLDSTDEVLIRDGGLPQRPRPPMNYMLTFSEHGLINEYVEQASALRDFKLVTVPGLSEVEAIDVPGLGRMEAAHAAGGLSTLARTCAGKVRSMDCKLIRYPGHCAVVNAMNAMGFFSRKPLRVGGLRLAPRQLSAALFRSHFLRPDEEDLVVIHTTVRGLKDGRPAEVVYDMLDRFERSSGMTAMMRTTGFPAAIVAQMLASGEIAKPGAYPVETGIPPEAFLAHMKRRGFDIRWSLRFLDRPATS